MVSSEFLPLLGIQQKSRDCWYRALIQSVCSAKVFFERHSGSSQIPHLWVSWEHISMLWIPNRHIHGYHYNKQNSFLVKSNLLIVIQLKKQSSLYMPVRFWHSNKVLKHTQIVKSTMIILKLFI